jgi:hypothetical protein
VLEKKSRKPNPRKHCVPAITAEFACPTTEYFRGLNERQETDASSWQAAKFFGKVGAFYGATIATIQRFLVFTKILSCGT